MCVYVYTYIYMHAHLFVPRTQCNFSDGVFSMHSYCSIFSQEILHDVDDDDIRCVDQNNTEGQLVMSMIGHVVSVKCIDFSPNALLLVTGCVKGWLNIWSLQVS